MSTEDEDPSPCPSPILQEGKTEFYENLQNKELEQRQRISEAMTWLRPIDRLFKARQIVETDNRLVRFSNIIAESRMADEHVSAYNTMIASRRVVDVAPLALDHNAATQDKLAVVQDS